MQNDDAETVHICGFEHRIRGVLMEEKQIQQFVGRVMRDENLRKAFVKQPEAVLNEEQFSPRVVRVLMKMVPHFAGSQQMLPLSWWDGS
jgi:hypothetical protein